MEVTPDMLSPPSRNNSLDGGKPTSPRNRPPATVYPALDGLLGAMRQKLSLAPSKKRRAKPPVEAPPPPPPEPEPARLLRASHIFDAANVAALEKKLPETLRGYNWKLLYSLQRHGAETGTFFARCQFDARTIVAVQTSRGEVFGGYVNSVWRPSAEYYGTGQSFLWRLRPGTASPKNGLGKSGLLRPFGASVPAAAPLARPAPLAGNMDAAGRKSTTAVPAGRDRVEAWTWTGANTYFAVCSENSIALGGGGGSFGLLVEEDFSRGSSGASETYGNPPLSASSEFEVVNLECWGFTTCATPEELSREEATRKRKAKPVLASKGQCELRR